MTLAVIGGFQVAFSRTLSIQPRKCDHSGTKALRLGRVVYPRSQVRWFGRSSFHTGLGQAFRVPTAHWLTTHRLTTHRLTANSSLPISYRVGVSTMMLLALKV